MRLRLALAGENLTRVSFAFEDGVPSQWGGSYLGLYSMFSKANFVQRPDNFEVVNFSGRLWCL